jgi:two-component system NtrC family sensor kinase
MADNENMIRAFTDILPDVIFETDGAETIVHVNNAITSLGFSSEEILGKTVRDLVYPDDIVKVDKCSSGPVVIRCRCRNLQKGVEEYIYAEFYFHAPSGMGMIRNISEERKREKALQMTRDQLFQSEKLASIGQLAASIAHEINNPLGFVTSNISTLQTYIGPLKEVMDMAGRIRDALEAGDYDKAAGLGRELAVLEKKHDIGFILEDLEDLVSESDQGLVRMKKIVMDLKLFARKDDSMSDAVDMNIVLESAVTIVWNKIKYNSKLKRELGDIPMVECNVQSMTQVFVNLLVNASQAIVANGEIILRTYEKDDYVCVEVQDSGSGIAPEIMDKIFDPLFTTKVPGEGTGLGLSISYEIVRKHSGSIRVNSEVGRGTTFTVSLPVKQ